MPRALWIAFFVGLVGAIFALQGIGVIGGSGMSGSSFWAVVGAIMFVGAIVFGLRTARTMPR